MTDKGRGLTTSVVTSLSKTRSDVLLIITSYYSNFQSFAGHTFQVNSCTLLLAAVDSPTSTEMQCPFFMISSHACHVFCFATCSMTFLPNTVISNLQQSLCH